jgi:predicted O-methyltransferase YrrM
VSGQTTAPLTWISPSEFKLDGLLFICDFTSHLNRETNEQNIIIAKSHNLIDSLYKHLSVTKPQTMLEIGIAQGGSAFLYMSLFNLSKYVGLDLRREDAKVLALLKEKYGPDRVKLYYQTSQTDKARIAQICNDEFGGLCDVVIDDGSHQYELSVQTVEVALPHLRPGGFYIIEDWGWAHWPGDKWQDQKTGYNIDKPALSNLVFELIMLCASRPDIISHGVIEKGLAAFQRGPSELDWRTFKLKESYLTQGRVFRTL